MIVHARPPTQDKKNDGAGEGAGVEEDKIERIAGAPLLSNNGVNALSSGLTALGAFLWATR